MLEVERYVGGGGEYWRPESMHAHDNPHSPLAANRAVPHLLLLLHLMRQPQPEVERCVAHAVEHLGEERLLSDGPQEEGAGGGVVGRLGNFLEGSQGTARALFKQRHE